MRPFPLYPTLSKASVPSESRRTLLTTTRTHQKMDYPELKGLRVLVVEDTWQVGKALKSALEGMGMVVAGPVATVADAELLLADRFPDLAVVDINLKGEFSYDLIDQNARSRYPGRGCLGLWRVTKFDCGGCHHSPEALPGRGASGDPATSDAPR